MTGRRASGVLAVLFTDLVGSTDLMVRLGDAAFDELRRDHFARLREVVAAHEGSEVKTTGDGIMATFPSAVSALAAAVAAQETTDHPIRIGLAIGEVAFEDRDVFGTPVVEAARLVAVAGSGQILATGAVRTMAGSRAPTRFLDLGERELKGLPRPVPVCQAIWDDGTTPSPPMPPHLESVPAPAAGPPGEAIPLVGRQELVDRLGKALDSARTGAGRLVLLTGEPGIGKSALAREVAARAGARGFSILWGTGWDGEGTPPFWPWVEALRSGLRHLDPGDRQALITASGEELVRLLPEFVPGQATARDRADDGDGARFRLFDGVSSLLNLLAERRPLLVVLDDLHWADVSSVGLLRFVAARARLAPILFLGTYRDTEISRDHPLRSALGELGTLADSVPVSALDQAAVRALLEQVYGSSLDDELVETAYRRTAGNPFFVGEVGRLMGSAHQGVLGSATSIPEGVRSVVERRLARLPQACHDLLGVASVVGQEADVSLLASVSGLPEPIVFELLGEAGQARVTQPSAGALPGARFTHDLFRETLYDALAGHRRVEVHRQIGLALERRREAGSAVRAAELAHHVLRGCLGTDDQRRAARYSLEAARDALERLALREGLVHAERALTTLEQTAAPDKEGLLETLLVLAETERRTGELERARSSYARAAGLARRLGETEGLSRAALGVHHLGGDYGEAHESTRSLLEEAAFALAETTGTSAGGMTKARVLAALARQCYHDRQRGSLDPGRLAAEAVDVAQVAGDPATLAFALWARYDTAWAPGSAGLRAEIAERMESVALAAGDLELRAQARLMRGIARLELADPGAVADFDGYSRLAEDLRVPSARYLAVTRQVTVATMRGDFDEAEQLLEEATLLGEAIGEPDRWNVENVELWALRTLQDRRPELEDRMRSWPHPIFVEWYAAKIVLCLVAKGAMEEAATTLARYEAFDPATQAPDNLWLSQVGTVAEAAAAVGHRPLAGRLYEALLPFAGTALITAGAVDFSGAVDHYLGLVAAALGRPEEAAGHFRNAVAMHERLGARPWAARSNRELAALTSGADNAPGQLPGVFSRDGDVWTLAFAGKEVRLKDAKGLRDIAVLLGAPGQAVSVGALLGIDVGEEAAQEAAFGADPVLDDRARAHYRARLQELEEDLADAEADHDPERAARARLERELLAEELAGAIGLGGRLRSLGGGSERARKAVTARIRNSLRRIEERHSELGAHLLGTITTGTTCSYNPAQPVEWRLSPP